MEQRRLPDIFVRPRLLNNNHSLQSLSPPFPWHLSSHPWSMVSGGDNGARLGSTLTPECPGNSLLCSLSQSPQIRIVSGNWGLIPSFIFLSFTHFRSISSRGRDDTRVPLAVYNKREGTLTTSLTSDRMRNKPFPIIEPVYIVQLLHVLTTTGGYFQIVVSSHPDFPSLPCGLDPTI